MPGALNALPRSRPGENIPGRDVSDVDRFHTKNSVLPRTYSHLNTTVPRSDLRLKSGLSSRVTGSNSNELGRASFADVRVVADGDERLQERLERHVAAEGVGRASGDVHDAPAQAPVDMILGAIAVRVGILDPLSGVQPRGCSSR